MGETDHSVTITCDQFCEGKVEGIWDSSVGHLNCTRWCREGCLEELPCQGGPKIVSQMRETWWCCKCLLPVVKSQLGHLGVQVCCLKQVSSVRDGVV